MDTGKKHPLLAYRIRYRRQRGLYFIGFPWLNTRKSGIIYGVEEDANFIANTLREQLA